MKTSKFQIICFLAGFLAVSSCATHESPQPTSITSASTQRPLLNSERIRLEFGSYGIDVICQSEVLRVSDLYSLHGGEKITRTLAVVIFPERMPPSILAEHQRISSGGSIGEVFKNNGWVIEKQSVFLGDLEPSPDFSDLYASMEVVGSGPLAVHVYDLSVAKNNTRHFYARIAEVHSPDYLDADDLHSIYGEAAGLQSVNSQSVDATLEMVTELLSQRPVGCNLPPVHAEYHVAPDRNG